MTPSQPDKASRTLTDRARALTAHYTHAIGQRVHRWGIHPDVITVIGLVWVALGSVLIGLGEFQAGAVMLLFALPFDALDGAVARAMGRTDQFGAMLDSTLDRYADGFIFAALSYHFAATDQFVLLLVAQSALIGSLLVSYTRARAEGLGVDCKVGWFTRLERILVIYVMLFIPALLVPGVIILAVGTQITALQRILYVYRTLKNRGN